MNSGLHKVLVADRGIFETTDAERVCVKQGGPVRRSLDVSQPDMRKVWRTTMKYLALFEVIFYCPSL